ncbi:hypothetical protein AMS68_002548 [Peltaster fructicola]|uniref:Uncharacterized protein n=1 Tax=Peltaster fructicola TaxID=286661 RepID=A0A6H0XQV3_9PEZI|nr:hypothetical protein AMS68_002548 [Peltaster fructicola]
MARTPKPGEREHDEAKEHFVDHTGRQAIRYGERTRDAKDRSSWPPTDYVKHPTFVFQVYLSVDLALNNAEETPEAERRHRASSGQNPETTRCSRLVRYLCTLFDVQRPEPIWEIYVMPGAHVLDFVEHSRYERLHRMRLRAAGQRNVPLIPKLAAQHRDDRKMAFLFGVESDQGWHRTDDSEDYCESIQWPANTGPLYVAFDPRLPPSVTTMDREWQMRSWTRNEEEMEWWDEQREMFITRVENCQLSEHMYDIGLRYRQSVYWPETDDLDCGMDFGIPARRHNTRSLHVDSMQTTLKQLEQAATALANEAAAAIPKLNCRSITIKQDSPDSLKLFNNKPNADPDIRYIVFVPSLVQPKQILKDVAYSFTGQLLECLSQDKTLELTFRSPPRPTDSSILSCYNDLQLPANTIGVWTDLQAPNSWRDPEYRPKLPYHRRLHPIDIRPHIRDNDPLTSWRQPYTAFIIIVDRPDFTSVPAIRFMLSGGGPNLERPETKEAKVRRNWYKGSAYNEMETWRTFSMESVVKRLTLAQHPAKAYW